MKGGTFKKAMTQPLMAPKTAMIGMTIKSAANQGRSGIQGRARAA